jgi:hypothetical protein
LSERWCPAVGQRETETEAGKDRICGDQDGCCGNRHSNLPGPSGVHRSIPYLPISSGPPFVEDSMRSGCKFSCTSARYYFCKDAIISLTVSCHSKVADCTDTTAEIRGVTSVSWEWRCPMCSGDSNTSAINSSFCPWKDCSLWPGQWVLRTLLHAKTCTGPISQRDLSKAAALWGQH